MQTKQIPLENFFRNPEKTAFQISPDGNYYSFMAPFEDRLNIFIQKIGEDSVQRLTNETARNISGYFWASGTRILYLKDSGGDENFKLFAVDMDGGNFKPLTDFEGVRTEIIDDLEDNENEVIVGLNKRDPSVFDPYRLNIKTGELTLLAENPGNIMSWLTDHDGKLRVATTSDGVNSTLLYREKEEDEFKSILTVSFKDTMSPLFFTFDNKNIYAASNLGRDKLTIVEFDLANGKEVKEIYSNPEYDVDNLFYSRKRKVITSAAFTSWKTERHFFDEETAEIFENLRAVIGDYAFSVTDSDKAETKFIVRSYSDRSLGAYYLYDKAVKKPVKIADVSPWLNETELARMKPISFTSRDGLTIHGYLTLPNNVSAEKLPVVVNPHGGPWHRDTWTFNPEVQFLANRGYAVLQINFRGSTGYGKKFWEASFKQWGKTMQNDITDGVQWLVSEGIADENRIAIYGGSYGGYATLAGLTYTPDLYACGVDYVGVSNLFTFMETIPPYWGPFREMMYEMVGHPEKDKDLLASASPALNAEKIKAPLFIAQGANDPRVNKNESDQMVNVLFDRGVKVEYMVKDNEGHGFQNEENRFEFYEAMERFLAAHIGQEVAVPQK